jgi:hypothetical protein
MACGGREYCLAGRLRPPRLILEIGTAVLWLGRDRKSASDLRPAAPEDDEPSIVTALLRLARAAKR